MIIPWNYKNTSLFGFRPISSFVFTFKVIPDFNLLLFDQFPRISAVEQKLSTNEHYLFPFVFELFLSSTPITSIAGFYFLRDTKWDLRERGRESSRLSKFQVWGSGWGWKLWKFMKWSTEGKAYSESGSRSLYDDPQFCFKLGLIKRCWSNH